MHRSESEQLVPCCVCGATVDASLGRSFVAESDRESVPDQVLCFDCAVARGGSYDPEEDRWTESPSLAEPD